MTLVDESSRFASIACGTAASYGHSKPRLAGKRILWVGLAGYSAESFPDSGWGECPHRLAGEWTSVNEALTALSQRSVNGKAVLQIA